MYRVHIKRTIFFAVIGVAAALAIALLSRKIYEGRLEILLGTNIQQSRAVGVFDLEVTEILDRNKAKSLVTERQLLSSETVFRIALNSVNPSLMLNWEELYLKYDVITARTSNQNQQGAGVAQIVVRAYSEDDAREIADAVASAYNEERRKAASASVDDAIIYVEAQIKSTLESLATAEQDVEDFMRENLTIDIIRLSMNETDYLTSLIQVREGSYAELRGLDNRIEVLEALIDKTPEEVPNWRTDIRNPSIFSLERDIIALETQKVIQLARYNEDNPKMKATIVALANTRALLVKVQEYEDINSSSTVQKNPERARLEAELSTALANKATVQGKLDSILESKQAQEENLSGLSATSVEYNRLQRDRAIFDDKYRRLKTQIEELENRRELGIKVSVALGDGAYASKDPVAPDIGKFIFIGLIAGACIGLVMSFSLESLRPRVYTTSQLGDLTGLPVVASIPSLPGLSRSRAVEALSQSGSSAMESFRNMAYSYIATQAEGSKCVMFTGIGTSGSSSIGAAQFAVALAHAGRKVVLVDAERTRQVITNGFGANDKKGVSDAIQQGADPTSMLVDTEHENLRLLPIGTVPDALTSHARLERVEALINSLRGEADIVVVAIAPTNLIADAAAFAATVDEVCLNVSARTNDYSEVPIAFDILEKAGAKSVKLILTDTNRGGEPFSSGTSIRRAD